MRPADNRHFLRSPLADDTIGCNPAARQCVAIASKKIDRCPRRLSRTVGPRRREISHVRSDPHGLQRKHAPQFLICGISLVGRQGEVTLALPLESLTWFEDFHSSMHRLLHASSGICGRPIAKLYFRRLLILDTQRRPTFRAMRSARECHTLGANQGLYRARPARPDSRGRQVHNSLDLRE